MSLTILAICLAVELGLFVLASTRAGAVGARTNQHWS